MWLPAWLLVIAVAVGQTSSEKNSLSRQRRDAGEKRIVCYYTNWSVYRPGTAKFNPQNINPYLCTHLVYAFGGLSKENSLKAFDKYQDVEQGGYAKFNGLKTYNKNLKTMVAIGGWNEGSARFSPLVADADRRKELIRNVIKFLRQNHFDGLDLDWEYPAFRDGGKPRDRDNYATFVQELREEFDRESSKTGRTRLLLTMAVPAGIEYIDKGYDVPKLNEYLDWFNILSYDYHSAFEPAVDHHAPLLALEPEDEYNFGSQLNIDATVKHYLKLGAERNKLVLGIPTYGRSYTLFNPDATDIGSPSDGPGEQGEATREKGYLAYYEICEKIKNEDWLVVNNNPDAMGPYAYKGNQWVGYDDEAIVRAKSKYVNENDLGGIMFWSIDNDDFRGKCHGKPYPLIEAAKEALLASSNELAPNEKHDRNSGSSKKQSNESSGKVKTRKNRPKPKTTTEAPRVTKTTPAYSTTTPQPPTTPDPGSDFVCKDEGFFPHPRDCKKYFWCLDSGPSSLGIVAHQFTCPSGLVFNKISDSCDYARNVICKNKPDPTTTTSAAPTTTTAKTTTTRTRLAITAAPPRHTTTTTTTTEEPEEYEEYEEEEEEDPGAIKELIGLIKRLGGVEQLEKQLKAQEGSKSTIKPSLFSKVLSGRTGNKFRGAQTDSSTAKYQSLFRSRGPQSSGSEGETESEGTKHQEKPQYVTIQRNRVPSRRPPEPDPKEEETEEESEEEEEATPVKSRRPSTTVEKEYVSLKRNNVRKGSDQTTPKYQSILRTRSTTAAALEEVEDDDEEEPDRVDIVEKPKKYSSVYREQKKPRIEDENEEKEKVSAVRPQYVTLTREKVTKPSEEEEQISSSPDPVNIVNNVKYVEFRRRKPIEASVTTEFVNNVYSPSDTEVVISSTEAEATSTEEVSITPTTSKYAIIRRKQVSSTEESVTENDIITSSSEPTTQKEETPKIVLETEKPIDERINLVERRNDAVTEVVRRRTRPPVLTTQPYTATVATPTTEASEEGINRFRIRPSQENRRISRPTTISTSSTSEHPVRRFQFAQRTKPTILTPVTKNETTFTIVVPETTIPFMDWTTIPIDTTTASEPSTERSGLPTTAFQKLRPTTIRPVPTTSTVTRVVTSITESSFTERQKIMVTKKPVFAKRITKSTTEKLVTDTPKPVRITRPYNPRRAETLTSTTPTTTTPRVLIKNKNSRFRPRSTTLAPVETSTEERKFVPKRGRSRGFSKFGEIVESTTADFVSTTPVTSAPRSEVSFRRRGAESLKTAAILTTTIRSEESFRRRGSVGSRAAVVSTTPVPSTLKSEESFRRRGAVGSRTAVVSTTTPVPTTLKSEEALRSRGAVGSRIDAVSTTTPTTTTFTAEGSLRRRVVSRRLKRPKEDLRTEESGSYYDDNDDDLDTKFILGESIKKTSGKDYLAAEVLFATVPTVEVEEKSAITVSQDTTKSRPKSVVKVFRGHKKAQESLIESVPDNYKKKIRKIVERRRPVLRTKSTESSFAALGPSEDYSAGDFGKFTNTEAETEISSSTTEAPAPRRSSQDYLNNLRSRSRATTSTTTTTERPQRRPGVNLDRRRKFRPERTTTARPDNLPDSTVTSPRSLQIRRRTRPTASTTTSTTTTTESVVEIESAEEREIESDLPDLADPAVVAIHNLATVAPVPVRQSPSPFSPSPFSLAAPQDSSASVVITPKPSTIFTNSPRPSTIAYTSAPRFSSPAFQETSPSLRTNPRISSVATSYSDFRQGSVEPSITTRIYTPSTTDKGITLEAIDTPSTRSEVVIAPKRQKTTTPATVPARRPTQRKLKPFSKTPKPGIAQTLTKPEKFSSLDYEYYDEADPLADVPSSALKVKVHSDGYIECLDQGNFPHPFSCKKFISCAKMENTDLLGWEYTCPKHLSFDPIGGICNWSAGLGCQH